MQRQGHDYDGQYDWVLKREGKDDQLKSLFNKGEPQPVPKLDIEERKD
jgi:hypothetical protein